ncbi:MAG: hypothetical protein ACYYKD_10190 [Rhodospirillales bacterium]
MSAVSFNRTVFINCPFDEDYMELLEAMLFCLISLGFTPRLANERLETGENRLDKIVEMISAAKYSIHDLSRCKAEKASDYFRMNMPFEYGLDLGLRMSGVAKMKNKKFLIFEGRQYELKKALSDAAGQDVEWHDDNYKNVIRKVRNFFYVEAGVTGAPGSARVINDYATFQGWMMDKKIYEGHSEADALNLPTRERLDEMQAWIKCGKPSGFTAPR